MQTVLLIVIVVELLVISLLMVEIKCKTEYYDEEYQKYLKSAHDPRDWRISEWVELTYILWYNQQWRNQKWKKYNTKR